MHKVKRVGPIYTTDFLTNLVMCMVLQKEETSMKGCSSMRSNKGIVAIRESNSWAAAIGENFTDFTTSLMDREKSYCTEHYHIV